MEAPLLREPARFKELLERFRVVFKKTSEVGKNLRRVGAEMVLDTFDVLFLRLRVESEQREKAGERFVPFLNVASHALSLFGQHQPAIFFVIEVTQFAQLLHHTGDRRLLDLQRRRDVHHTGVTFLLNQLMNTLQVVFGALTGSWWRGHVAPINHKNRRRRKREGLEAQRRSPTGYVFSEVAARAKERGLQSAGVLVSEGSFGILRA